MTVNVLELDNALSGSLLGELHWAFRASRVLYVANNLDLFTRLSGTSATAAELAVQCGTDPIMTEKLLICCCALDLLHKVEGRYRNTQIAETYLVRGAPLYQGDIIGHSGGLWDFWQKLEAVVYKGSRDVSPDDIPDSARRDGHRDFIWGMHNISITGPAQMVANNADLTGCRRLLDVGGGPGTYSIALCQKYPELTAVIFDRPETLVISREVISQFGLQERILVEEGDWNQERYGKGYDAVLFSNVLHGARSGALDKLRKSRAALIPGGRLVVHDFLLNNEKTGPLDAAFFNMMIGAYSIREMIDVIAEAGFVDVQMVAFGDRGDGVVTATKPDA